MPRSLRTNISTNTSTNINTNTNNTGLVACVDQDRIDGVNGGGCYDPNGGILAKVRFRESKTSQEALDFLIALSCGEVCAGRDAYLLWSATDCRASCGRAGG